MDSSTKESSTAKAIIEPWGPDVPEDEFPESYERTWFPEEPHPQSDSLVASDRAQCSYKPRRFGYRTSYNNQRVRTAQSDNPVPSHTEQEPVMEEKDVGVLLDGRLTLNYPPVLKYIEEVQLKYGFDLPADLLETCLPPEDPRVYALIAVWMKSEPVWPIWWVFFNAARKDETRRIIEAQVRGRHRVPDEWLVDEAKRANVRERNRQSKRKLKDVESREGDAAPTDAAVKAISKPQAKKRKTVGRGSIKKQREPLKKSPLAEEIVSEDVVEDLLACDDKIVSTVGEEHAASSAHAQSAGATAATAESGRLDTCSRAEDAPSFKSEFQQADAAENKPGDGIVLAEPPQALQVDRPSVAATAESSTAFSASGTKTTAVASKSRHVLRKTRLRPVEEVGEVDKGDAVKAWLSGSKDAKEPETERVAKAVTGKGEDEEKSQDVSIMQDVDRNLQRSKLTGQTPANTRTDGLVEEGSESKAPAVAPPADETKPVRKRRSSVKALEAAEGAVEAPKRKSVRKKAATASSE